MQFSNQMRKFLFLEGGAPSNLNVSPNKSNKKESVESTFFCVATIFGKKNQQKLRQVSSKICGVECHLGGGFKCFLFSSLFWEMIYIIY